MNLSPSHIKELQNIQQEREQFFDYINQTGRYSGHDPRLLTHEQRITEAIRKYGKDYR